MVEISILLVCFLFSFSRWMRKGIKNIQAEERYEKCLVEITKLERWHLENE